MYWCRSYPIIRKYWILSTIDRVFWPIIIYWVYVTFGPWAIAEVIDDHYGIMFIWGVYIDEHITPGSFTYLYGALQLFLCQLPLIIIFSACIEKRFLIYIGKPKQKRIGSIRSLPLFSQAPFFFILAVEMLLAVCFGISYGAVAFFLTPTRTWSVVMNLLLWYLSRNMPEYCYRLVLHTFFFVFFCENTFLSIILGQRHWFGVIRMQHVIERIVMKKQADPMKSDFKIKPKIVILI